MLLWLFFSLISFSLFSLQQAVKSLKRNCSTSCRDRNFSYQHEKHRVLGIGRSAFSRFDMKYSSKVLKNLTAHERSGHELPLHVVQNQIACFQSCWFLEFFQIVMLFP